MWTRRRRIVSSDVYLVVVGVVVVGVVIVGVVLPVLVAGVVVVLGVMAGRPARASSRLPR